MASSKLLVESLARYWSAMTVPLIQPLSFPHSAHLFYDTETMWITLKLSALVLLLVFVLRAFLRFVYRPLRLINLFKKQGIKGAPFKLVFGQMGDMRKSTKMVEQTGKNLAYIAEWQKQYGDVFYYCLGPKVRLAVLDPGLAHQVFHATTGNGGNYRKPDFAAEVFEPVLGRNGLVFTSNERWPRQRKLVNPMFAHSKLKDMEPYMVASAQEMVYRWEEKINTAGGRAEIEVNEELSGVARDIICRTVFGHTDAAADMYSGQNIYQDFGNLLKDITGRSFGLNAMLIPGYKYLPIPINFRIARTRQRIRNMFLSIITNRRAKAAADAKATGKPLDFGDDLLGSLLAASDEQGSLSSDELMDQCKTFFFAGHETSGHALTWTMLLLSQHPEWQEKARAEVHEVCGDAPPDRDSVNKLKVVTMVLREAMRLFPPVIFVSRQVSKAHTLGNIHVPKDHNLQIALPIYTLHRDPATWGPDADVFKPERFENSMTGGAKDPHAYVPFAAGPRNCVGQQFALMEAKTVLAMVLQRFRFSVAPGYKHWPHSTITLRPKLGLPLLVERLG